MLNKKLNKKMQITNTKERIKIVVIGIVVIVAVLIGGFFLGEYGKSIEAEMMATSNNVILG